MQPDPPSATAYYRDLAGAYDEISRGVPGDVEFYVALAREAGGPVVELGAGTGRVAIPMALAGAEVIAIDREPAMLAIAREKAAAAGIRDRLQFIEDDMRSFAIEQPAALVVIPHRTFLHNLTEADQEATLAACRRALRPEGRLALNVFNPDLTLIARRMHSAGHWEPFGRRSTGPRSEGLRGGSEVQGRHNYEPVSQLVTTTLRARDETGRWQRSSFTLRYVDREEMEALFARAGFAVESLHGDFSGAPFQDTSPEMVWVVRASA